MASCATNPDVDSCAECTITQCPNRQRGQNGRFLPGHTSLVPRLPLSVALNRRLNDTTSQAIADVLIALAMAGSIKAIELILERTEGRVPLTLNTDTEINVIHNIPGPNETHNIMPRRESLIEESRWTDQPSETLHYDITPSHAH